MTAEAAPVERGEAAGTPFARWSFALPAAGDGLPIRGDVYEPPGGAARATALVVHGWKGFARWGFFPLVAARLAAAGIRAVAHDASGSGVGPDRESFTEPARFEANTFSRELDDLETVRAWAEGQGWLARPYGVLGHSRGGGMAILHAAARAADAIRPGALVTWSAISTVARTTPEEVARWREVGWRPVVNIRTGQRFRQSTSLLDDAERHARGRLDIAGAASRVGVPWLLVHGVDDETVPVAEGRRLAAAADAARTTVRLVPGLSHAFGATHPLLAPGAALDALVRESVDFLVGRLA